MSPPIKINHDEALDLYRQGYSDREIANSLTGVICCTQVINRWRKQNGLPTNHFGLRHRQKLAEAKKAQIKKEGITLTRKNRANECIKSLDYGWNVPLTKEERRVADCLLDGEKTSHELRLLIKRSSLSRTISSMTKQGFISRRKTSRSQVLYTLTENCGKST